MDLDVLFRGQLTLYFTDVNKNRGYLEREMCHEGLTYSPPNSRSQPYYFLAGNFHNS